MSRTDYKPTIGGPRPAWRDCNMCHREFWSEGPWNRRCPKCQTKLDRQPPDGLHFAALTPTLRAALAGDERFAEE